MSSLHDLLDKNRYWSESLTARDPDHFPALSRQQHPNTYGLAVLIVEFLPMKWWD